MELNLKDDQGQGSSGWNPGARGAVRAEAGGAAPRGHTQGEGWHRGSRRGFQAHQICGFRKNDYMIILQGFKSMMDFWFYCQNHNQIIFDFPGGIFFFSGKIYNHFCWLGDPFYTRLLKAAPHVPFRDTGACLSMSQARAFPRMRACTSPPPPHTGRYVHLSPD